MALSLAMMGSGPMGGWLRSAGGSSPATWRDRSAAAPELTPSARVIQGELDVAIAATH